MGELRRVVIHPFLFAAYPVLSLLAHNIGQVTWVVAIRPLIVSLVLALGLLSIGKLATGTWERSGIITSLILILFFSYGHIYDLLKSTTILGILIARHRYLMPLWAILFMSGLLISRFRRRVQRWTYFLNVFSIILLVYPFMQLSWFAIRSQIQPATSQYIIGEAVPLGKYDFEGLPDIYYIILDEYPRQDVLQESYDFDNSEFLEDLRELGFYVAEKSQSNYAQSELSLASSLNFNYLRELGVGLNPSSIDRAALWPLIKKSAARKKLEMLEYTIVAFETGYSWSQWEDADIYSGPSKGIFARSNLSGGLSDFEVLFLRKSGAIILADGKIFLPNAFTPYLQRPARWGYELVTFVLDQLALLPELSDPKFVFAHILAPHPPYVFSTSGDYIGDQYLREGGLGGEEELYSHNVEGHRRSLTYINSRILQLVDEIIAKSKKPPIIILQADHGVPFSSHEDRMAILNAYYLPLGGDELLYENISPVNTFRVVFNYYFDEELDLLKDESYFSSYSLPYEFIPVKDD